MYVMGLISMKGTYFFLASEKKTRIVIIYATCSVLLVVDSNFSIAMVT